VHSTKGHLFQTQNGSTNKIIVVDYEVLLISHSLVSVQ